MEIKLKRLRAALLALLLLSVALTAGGAYYAADYAVGDLLIARGCDALLEFMVRGLSLQFERWNTTDNKVILRYCDVLRRVGEPIGLVYLYVVDGGGRTKFEFRDPTLESNRNDKSGLEKYLERLTSVPTQAQHNTYTLSATRRKLIDIVRPTGNGYLRVGFLADRVNAHHGPLLQWLLVAAGVVLVLVLALGLTVNGMAARVTDRLLADELEKLRGRLRADFAAEQKKLQQAESRKADDAPLDSNEFFGIIDLAKKVGDTFVIEDVLRHAVGAIVRVLGVQEVMIFLVDEHGTELKAAIGHDSTGLIEPAVIHDVRVRVGQGEIGGAAEYGGTNVIDTPLPGTALVSALAARGQVVGVFRAKGKVNGKPFGRRDKLIGRQFADLIGNALYNAMLYQATGAVPPGNGAKPA